MLAFRGDCPGIQSSAWYLVGPPTSASLLAASVERSRGLEVAEGAGMENTLSSPYSGPVPPLFHQSLGAILIPLLGESFHE